MADENLRMVAEVVDRFSGPLNNLRTQLNGVKASPHMAAMKRDFVEIEGSVSKAANTVRNALSPALASMGVASLGATIGIAAVGSAVANMVTGAADLRRFSNEVGVSIDKLRELSAVGQRFGIDPGQMQQALRGAQATAQDFAQRGQKFTDLMSKFPEALGKPLASSKSMDEFVENAIRGLMTIENHQKRSEAATEIFGSNIFAGVTGAEFETALKAARENLAKLPKDAAEAAEQLRQRLYGLREQIEAFRDKAFAPFIPKIEEFVRGLSSIGTAEVDNPKLAALVDDTRKWIEETDWKKAGREFGGEFVSALNDIKDAIKTIQEFRNSAVGPGSEDTPGGALWVNKHLFGGRKLRNIAPTSCGTRPRRARLRSKPKRRRCRKTTAISRSWARLRRRPGSRRTRRS
ncbi:hypothetical protein JNW90_23685 [Micromonospora sp. STR1s_5]|nr:hypothetical protein [Micromonospora sp. STR1s_5]